MADDTVVYFVQGLHGYKIGLTNNVDKRMATFKTANPHIRLITHSAYLRRDTATWMERALHVRYAHKRISGEWFDLGPKEVNEVMEILKGRNSRTELRRGHRIKIPFWLFLLASLTASIICVSMVR